MYYQRSQMLKKSFYQFYKLQPFDADQLYQIFSIFYYLEQSPEIYRFQIFHRQQIKKIIIQMQYHSTRKMQQTKTSRKSIQPVNKTKRFNYLSSHKTMIMHNNNKIIEKVPDLLEKGKTYYKQNNLKMAIQCFTSAAIRDQNNIQINYMLGVCYLSINKLDQAINSFNKVLGQNPTYKKNIFLLVSICYKKKNQLEQAIQYITQAFNYFQEYFDAYVYRAKLFMKLKKFESALDDLNKALHIDPHNLVANQAKGDCNKMNNNTKQAIQCYSKCLQIESNNTGIIQKRAISYYEIKQYKLALKDFDQLIKNKIINSEIYYFKAMIYLKQKNISNATLYFQQAITDNSSIKAVTKSIQQLAIIKIQARDFYQAYEVLKRSDFIQTEKGYIEKLKKFVQGVTFLMKRKFQEAEQNFKQIQEEWCNHPKKNYQFLVSTFYTYRAYGYFCLGKHKEALQNYQKVDDQFQKDSGFQYNKLLCEGILSYPNKDRNHTIKIFENALKILQRMQPYFYIGVNLIQQSLELQTSDNILKALQTLTEGLQLQQSSNLYYYRCLVYLFLSMNSEAIQDIDKAIQKSEDNVPKYFYIRGLIFAIQGNYKQAISDLSTCITLDQAFYEAYLERAKCNLLENQITAAYSDIEFYPENKRWIAIFFIHNNQYEEALQILEKEDEQLFEMTNLKLGIWNQSGVSGKLCSAVINNNSDIETLIDSAIESEIGIGYFHPCDLLLLKAYMMYQSDIMESIEYFKKALVMISSSTNQQITLQQQQYNDVKMIQIKCNIIFAFIEKGQIQEAINLLLSMKEDIIYNDLKQKIQGFISHLKGQKKIKVVDFFNQNQMLTKYLKTFTFKNLDLQYKLYINYPLLPFPSVTCSFNFEILKNFTISNIQNKPEAPWIKRNVQGIVFTDEIQVFEHLKLETSVCQQGDQQQEQNDKSDQSFVSDSLRKIEKLKQQLKLDSKIEQKLNKLTAKRQNID